MSRNMQRRIVTWLGALQAEVDALKRLQAETAAELAGDQLINVAWAFSH